MSAYGYEELQGILMQKVARLGWEGSLSMPCEIYKLDSDFVLEFRDLLGEYYSIFIDDRLTEELKDATIDIVGTLCNT